MVMVVHAVINDNGVVCNIYSILDTYDIYHNSYILLTPETRSFTGLQPLATA